MTIAVKNYDQLPLALKIDQVAELWGVSRKIAYQVCKNEGLAIRVGEKRLIVPRDRFIRFMEKK